MTATVVMTSAAWFKKKEEDGVRALTERESEQSHIPCIHFSEVLLVVIPVKK